MTQRSAPDHDTVVSALRAALAAEADCANRPGLLRIRMQDQLGTEAATRLRVDVHQVVAAAEEHLPANLVRIAPLTVQSLQRLTDDLAMARGWSVVAAQRTTMTWASALGFDELVATSWPRPDPAFPPLAPHIVDEPTMLPPAQPPLDNSNAFSPPQEASRGAGPESSHTLQAAPWHARIPRLALWVGSAIVLLVVLSLVAVATGGS